jgi:hypothetical protein
MERTHMKKTIAMAALTLSLVPSATMAQHRGGDAALGALSGAVVFGPVGALAGAVVGYTAGPSIARSWGFRRSDATRHARKSAPQPTRISRAETQPALANQAAPVAPLPAKTASTAPPVQGLE